MKPLLRALVLPLALLAAAPSSGTAQARIAPGSYELVPDANFSAGFDVAGLVVEFTEKTMVAIHQGALVVKSTLTYDGDVVTLTDVEGDMACPNTAKYRVSMTDKGMRLVVVDDSCDGRGAVLAQVTFVKKG